MGGVRGNFALDIIIIYTNPAEALVAILGQRALYREKHTVRYERKRLYLAGFEPG